VDDNVIKEQRSGRSCVEQGKGSDWVNGGQEEGSDLLENREKEVSGWLESREKEVIG
jgi:hypothetical protein